MRTLLASALLASLTLFATGCPFAGCGAFEGGNDQVFARGGDQLVLCNNGGFSATVGSTTTEGYFSYTPATGSGSGSAMGAVYTATNGATGDAAFTLTLAYQTTDGHATGTIPEYGAGTWDYVALDKVSLDHADTLCQNLETRDWWSSAN